MKRTLPVILVALAIALPGPARASNVFGDDEIIVAVLDTGIRATHQEFDYRGPTDLDDQIVAWWDFTPTMRAVRHPALGQTWDPEIANPYDDDGHGTATAALAVGRNVGADAKPSYAPGTKLAVGRVCVAGGSCPGSVAAAIEWASGTVGADVISISIGAQMPLPDILFQIHEAARLARQRGTLVVVSNGNGLGNTAGPSPGWATPHADSTEVLTVGAADAFGAAVTSDPEVTADYFLVPVASRDCDTCYTTNIGTSFAAPTVAGVAAAAMAAAIAGGHDAGPDTIETLIKYAATDTAIPPNFEGYGEIDDAAATLAVNHAAAGTLPPRPDPDLNATYVETIGGTLRDTWSNRLDGDLWGYRELPYPPTTPPQVLGTSVAPGVTEGERYTVPLAAGEVLQVAVEAEYEFFELQMYRGTGPEALTGANLVANASYGAPSFTFRSHDDATYTVIVAGFSVLIDLPYSIGSTSSIHGDDVLTFDGQSTYAAVTLYTS